MSLKDDHEFVFLQIKCSCPAELKGLQASKKLGSHKARSYEFQLPVPTIHAPVNEREDLVVAEVCLSHFVTGQTAVLMPTHWHHAFQVQFCNLPLFGMVSVKAIVQTGEHLLPLVLQSLVFTSKHPQGQHNKQH